MGRKRRVSDEQIVEAARACFEEFGADVSVDSIARRLGVTAPVIYMRFGSKLNLFYESMLPKHMPALEPLLRLAGGPDERGIEAQFGELTRLVLALCDEMVGVIGAIARNPVRMDDALKLMEAPWPSPVLERLETWLRSAHALRRMSCAEPAFFASLWLGACYSQIARVRQAQAPFSADARDALADQIAASLWSGLAPPKPAARRTSFSS